MLDPALLRSVRCGRERRHDELKTGQAERLRGRRDVQLRDAVDAAVLLPRNAEPPRRTLGHVRVADARQRARSDGRRRPVGCARVQV